MRTYNNPDIILTERAARSFLKDLFSRKPAYEVPDLTEDYAEITEERRENDEVIYHIPEFTIRET